jgi:hypothetical protein
MECPRCGENLPVILCQDCRGESPPGSLHCCRCGHALKVAPPEAEASERTLCSDGACIGTINEKGVCNACGKPYTGEPA